MPRVYPPLEGKEPILTLDPKTVDWVAGSVAGVATTLVVHPFDILKTRIQLEQNAKSQVGNSWRVARQIASESWHEGYRSQGRLKDSAQVVRSFYRGLFPNAFGNSISWGIFFVFYGRTKTWIASTRGLPGKDKAKLSWLDYLAASSASGAATAIITNPIWVIKTRMLSTARNTPGAYTSTWQGIMATWKLEGLRGFYRGLTPSLIGVSHGGVQFMAYELLKGHWADSREGGMNGLTNLDVIQLSSTSKAIAGSLTYPYQVVRSRLQTYDAQTKYKGVWDVVKQVHKYEGVRGFYKGLGPNIIRVLPSVCVTFLVYENVKFHLPRMMEPKDELALTMEAE